MDLRDNFFSKRVVHIRNELTEEAIAVDTIWTFRRPLDSCMDSNNLKRTSADKRSPICNLVGIDKVVQRACFRSALLYDSSTYKK